MGVEVCICVNMTFWFKIAFHKNEKKGKRSYFFSPNLVLELQKDQISVDI